MRKSGCSMHETWFSYHSCHISSCLQCVKRQADKKAPADIMTKHDESLTRLTVVKRLNNSSNAHCIILEERTNGDLICDEIH